MSDATNFSENKKAVIKISSAKDGTHDLGTFAGSEKGELARAIKLEGARGDKHNFILPESAELCKVRSAGGAIVFCVTMQDADGHKHRAYIDTGRVPDANVTFTQGNSSKTGAAILKDSNVQNMTLDSEMSRTYTQLKRVAEKNGDAVVVTPQGGAKVARPEMEAGKPVDRALAMVLDSIARSGNMSILNDELRSGKLPLLGKLTQEHIGNLSNPELISNEQKRAEVVRSVMRDITLRNIPEPAIAQAAPQKNSPQQEPIVAQIVPPKNTPVPEPKTQPKIEAPKRDPKEEAESKWQMGIIERASRAKIPDALLFKGANDLSGRDGKPYEQALHDRFKKAEENLAKYETAKRQPHQAYAVTTHVTGQWVQPSYCPPQPCATSPHHHGGGHRGGRR